MRLLDHPTVRHVRESQAAAPAATVLRRWTPIGSSDWHVTVALTTLVSSKSVAPSWMTSETTSFGSSPGRRPCWRSSAG